MESTDAGNSAEPELILYRNSPSPASGDYLGQIQFKGENANGGSEIYAKVTGKISDPTHSSEDGLIETAIKGDGSFTIVSRQKADELQLINGVNLDVAGNIAVGGTVDGVDIQTLNTTAGAALPKAGGTMTGALNIGSVGNLTNSGSDLKITGTDDIFFNVAGASNNILQLYGGSSANDQSKFDSHVHPLTDNSKDLGNASERWKDLYLSGGLKVGGTGSANTLDDYEEGTYTPVFKDTSNASMTGTLVNAIYTKVGRLVHVMVYYVVGDSQNGNLTTMTLPFSQAGSGRGAGSITTYHCPHANASNDIYLNGGSKVAFWQVRNNATSLTMAVDNGSELILSMTYMAS
jgi:hypothetical protein